MTHLLVDAMSVNNYSGRHVLLGHLGQMVRSLPNWRFTLLTHSENAGLAGAAPEEVRCFRAPVGASWLARSLWSRRNGPSLCRKLAIDMVFSPSGMLAPGLPRPQLVLAQNPLPLLPGMSTGRTRTKAFLQRQAFGRAQRHARVMAFNSSYMRELYGAWFGLPGGRSVIAYQGIDDQLFTSDLSRLGWAEREPIVLSVSVMARHKAVEVLVDAFAIVRAGVADARLYLVGAWPDPSYLEEVRTLVRKLGIENSVSITGYVSDEELRRLYGISKVYCLLSRCESFGIPAIEAQAFGTPTVVAADTAAPEVARGRVVASNDPTEAARALQELLGSETAWNEQSEAAMLNVQRFWWSTCSEPLVLELKKMESGLV
jgi:glycosyltransferase involved in cell wall biosynthesis